MLIAKKSKQKGFTLVEVLLSLAIFVILTYGVTLLFTNISVISNQKSILLNSVDRAKRVAFNFASELRNITNGSDGSFALNQAGDFQIIFYTNAGAKTNRIRYYLSGNTLYKGVIVPTGTPLTYNPATETITAIPLYLVNSTTPVFYYYNDSYDGTGSSLSQPINVNNVKYIKINLMLQNKNGAQGTISTFSISQGAALRSLKTNLGN